MKDNRWIGAKPFVFEDFGKAADGGGAQNPEPLSPLVDTLPPEDKILLLTSVHGSQREPSGELSRELSEEGSKPQNPSSGRVTADEDDCHALSLLKRKIQELDLRDPQALDFLKNLGCAEGLRSLNKVLVGDSSQKERFKEIVDLYAELYHLLRERTYVGDGYDKSGASGDILSALDRVLSCRNEPL